MSAAATPIHSGWRSTLGSRPGGSTRYGTSRYYPPTTPAASLCDPSSGRRGRSCWPTHWLSPPTRGGEEAGGSRIGFPLLPEARRAPGFSDTPLLPETRKAPGFSDTPLLPEEQPCLSLQCQVLASNGCWSESWH